MAVSGRLRAKRAAILTAELTAALISNAVPGRGGVDRVRHQQAAASAAATAWILRMSIILLQPQTALLLQRAHRGDAFEGGRGMTTGSWAPAAPRRSRRSGPSY